MLSKTMPPEDYNKFIRNAVWQFRKELIPISNRLF